MHHYVFMHRGYPFSFYNGTNAYVTKQENDHYIYHNNVTIVYISNAYPTSTAVRECSPDEKMAQKVREPTGGFILARVAVCRIVNIHPITRLE